MKILEFLVIAVFILLIALLLASMVVFLGLNVLEMLEERKEDSDKHKLFNTYYKNNLERRDK